VCVRRFRACKRKRALWKKSRVDRIVGGDPVNYIDKDGRFVFIIALAIAGAYVGGSLMQNESRVGHTEWNPTKWDYKSSATYFGIVGGGLAGAGIGAVVEGGVASYGITLTVGDVSTTVASFVPGGGWTIGGASAAGGGGFWFYNELQGRNSGGTNNSQSGDISATTCISNCHDDQWVKVSSMNAGVYDQSMFSSYRNIYGQESGQPENYKKELNAFYNQSASGRASLTGEKWSGEIMERNDGSSVLVSTLRSSEVQKFVVIQNANRGVHSHWDFGSTSAPGPDDRAWAASLLNQMPPGSKVFFYDAHTDTFYELFPSSLTYAPTK